MSWNRSTKHLTLKCPECGSERVSACDTNFEWRCGACESVGPEFPSGW